ncbi:MAG: ABC transporter ATP-binding protein [Gammaproteobacteria bacterium]|jgi:putative ABC transport system ATP-binding protein|nr:ABC transporter ATP-binding protein [Chromatiales bacterium]MDP7419398.1 ABC transporter ATP-binding protein [Gammaproteobacteria bacterium]MDP7661244.1 ABC transporter ATP-binding protein [Gammaproteobacteria bacterium]HJP37825.1 ABC transporter ATP-binding protein [Gammaproteobacteria bacterium]
MSLKVENVSLVFGDGNEQVKALDNVSMDLQPGQLMAVLGPSGAGKSSLLAVCGGLLTPSNGKISVGEMEITSVSQSALTRIRQQQIGFVFQQSNLLSSVTAIDQLLLLVHMRGKRPDQADRERAAKLLGEVGMEHRLNRRPNELSGGERQRVGIARAFMMNPKLLLVDEPTSMLDHHRGKQIVELLVRECHEHNVATLMVTHDHGILDAADRVVDIRDGKFSERTQ